MAVFPNSLASDSTRWNVSSEVAMPRMTSTSAITGTGFMKCMPMTLSGRLVTAAIFVIEIDDVFEARMHSGPARASSLAKRSSFAVRLSTMASMTMSAAATASKPVAVRMRPATASFSAAVIFPLSTPRWRLAEIVDRARWRASPATSTRVTSKPAAAAVWAIPFPIVPAPMTTMFFMARPYHGVRSSTRNRPYGVEMLHVRCGDLERNPLREMRQAA
jgi:hypothetical protein